MRSSQEVNCKLYNFRKAVTFIVLSLIEKPKSQKVKTQHATRIPNLQTASGNYRVAESTVLLTPETIRFSNQRRARVQVNPVLTCARNPFPG